MTLGEKSVEEKYLFHRGDADDNGVVQLTDAVRILGVLFPGRGSIPSHGPTTDAFGADPIGDEPVNQVRAYAQGRE